MLSCVDEGKSDDPVRECPEATFGESSSWEGMELGANEGCGSCEMTCASAALR